MSEFSRVGDLQVNEDMRFQRWEWTVQRVGWVVMFLFVVAGVGGLLGRGPLSEATKTSADGQLGMEYERFLHYRAASTLRVSVQNAAASASEIRVALARAYLRQINVERITPTPVRVEAGADRHYFVFLLADSARPTSIDFHFTPESIGTLSGEVRLQNGQAVQFEQFVYP